MAGPAGLRAALGVTGRGRATRRDPSPEPGSGSGSGWFELARRLSPRWRVRVDERDAAGCWRHEYAAEVVMPAVEPDGPWAVYLADDRQRFHLVLLDLDARRGRVDEDLAEVLGWCARAGLRPIAARSGPGGGAHVWLVLAEPAPAEVVARLARAAAARLPSLDCAPLLNPRTGCGRPPGSPHRAGGRSEPLTALHSAHQVAADGGDPPEALARLLALLGAAGPSPTDPPSPATGPALKRGAAIDADGLPYLPGQRRALSEAGRAALATPVEPGGDASVQLARVLVCAARAHWRYADVAALLPTAPGLEHARTRHQPGTARRVPRGGGEPAAVLERQWRRCVAFAVDCPAPDRDSDAAERAAAAVATDVAATQQRADAAPGRWARPGGPADRRVLDAVCLLTLTALRGDVEADIRRLGLMTGICRETARAALYRLAADGWIHQVEPAAGRRAARWALPPAPALPRAAPSTASAADGLSQATPRPAGAGVLRDAWRSRLEQRLEEVAHDALGHFGLGHHLARMVTALQPGVPLRREELAQRLDYGHDRFERFLDQLVRWGLAVVTDRITREPGDLATVARELGVAGTGTRRAHRYGVERQAWAWWCDELDWMRARAGLPRTTNRRMRRRRPGTGQAMLPGLARTVRDERGPHPRRPNGRADFAAAAAAVAGALPRRNRSSRAA